jgi:hypothetical protein
MGAQHLQAPRLAVLLQPDRHVAEIDVLGDRERRHHPRQRVTGRELKPQPARPLFSHAAGAGAEAVGQLRRGTLEVLRALPEHQPDENPVTPRRRVDLADPWDGFALAVALPQPRQDHR